MAAKKKQHHDWERIEPGWRAGIKSVLQLAADYEQETGRSISHTAINKHFKKLGIKRDLSHKVKDKAKAMVSAAMVSGKVSTETTATDAEIIETEALSVAEVKFNHRVDIPRKRELVAKLFAEIEAQTDGQDLLEQLRIALGQADLAGMSKLVDKVTSLPSRIKGVSDLVGAYKALIALERQAYNLEEDGDNRSDRVSDITTDELVAILKGE